ncbi:hypothetical protein E4T81_14775 [Barnesiella sp. WM24]|uniref:hypothetical protein n=1 Tax=Barnesiella sp. WM24 TaxID=2558278 RepID=UPI001072D436|nr:hypothetical protein [Barnesiella sp. WM24]TFU91760.1 hypothetical protein E4T81_14775 [Barnesiella sp. WM24]
MKKLLTKADLAKIAKAYNLNNEEKAELNDYAETLNDEQKNTPDCSETHFELFNSIGHKPTAERRAAIIATILYLTKRIQDARATANELCKEVYSLRGISVELAIILNVYSDNLKWFFIGLWNNPRFNRSLYTAHACGLDTLEIY